MRKRILFYGVVLLLLVLPFGIFRFGRSLWYPVYATASGKLSVEQVVSDLEQQGVIDFDPSRWSRLLLFAMKEERSLEVWGESYSGSLVMIAEFPFTGYSGQLGPKLKEGDLQIPEGLYRVEYLNPNSSYHLSIKVSYPNAFDRAKGELDGRDNLGGDIFIHGDQVTIGCIPIGDANIEKLFLMVAQMGRERVDIVIVPYDMRTRPAGPEIASVDWEHDLYESIAREIHSRFSDSIGAN